jgi:hypothetical protein
MKTTAECQAGRLHELLGLSMPPGFARGTHSRPRTSAARASSARGGHTVIGVAGGTESASWQAALESPICSYWNRCRRF